MSEETTELTWRRGWCGHARKLCKWKAREFELRFFRAIPGGRRHFGHRRRDSVAYHGRRVCVSP